MSGDQERIVEAIIAERNRQDEKWGEQNHTDTIWSLIFGEEYGEVQKEVLECECSWGEKSEAHDQRVENELVQLIAVGVGWLEARERRKRRNNTPEARERRATANALFNTGADS